MAEVKETAVAYEVEPEVEPAIYIRPPIYYPVSDGKPLAETDVHIEQIIYLREALADRFRDDPQVYVAANLFVYYEEGDPSQVVAPDVFVVKGVPKRQRRIFQVWKEGKGPDVVFEITSRRTRREDLGPKKGTYEVLGVQEYFLFDPLGEYLDPPLLGFRLAEWGYRPIEEDPLVSRVLGLELHVEGNFLRLVDPKTGEKLLTPLEAQEARRRAEAELERLRAELARLRGDSA
ncbi:MAG: Uma2 family endonuclease [Chloroflexi bacterium]|nr:MAG: Uma2 family endonuclease [Chloroflexota bacterium]